LSFQAEKNIPDVLHNLGSNALIEEGCCKDFEDECCTTSMVAQDSLEDLIVGREEQSLEDGVACLRLELLIDNLQNSKIGNLMCTEVDKMRYELRCKNCASLRECTGIEEPGKK
jgi:hypothetical protein